MAAIQVASSGKGAKNRTHGRELCSTGTKGRARFFTSHQAKAALEKKLKAHTREFKNNLDALTRRGSYRRPHRRSVLSRARSWRGRVRRACRHSYRSPGTDAQ